MEALISSLTEANAKLMTSDSSLTAEVSEIRKALAQKDEQTQKLVAKLNALTKISLPKKNESRKKEVDPAADKSASPTPKEQGNKLLG